MSILPRRLERLKSVLNHRMKDLTVLLENVEKPHNLSAILRSCDAVGALEAHSVSKGSRSPTFNSTAQGSQKWVNLHSHENIKVAVESLKEKGFILYGTSLKHGSIDYRKCDFTKPTAFVLGAEKWGLTDKALELMDISLFIPMRGMVQSLNVSVAAGTLLFEALRQRERLGIIPQNGEGIGQDIYKKVLFEWAYPEVAKWCRLEERVYPEINEKGEIKENLPRTFRMRC